MRAIGPKDLAIPIAMPIGEQTRMGKGEPAGDSTAGNSLMNRVKNNDCIESQRDSGVFFFRSVLLPAV